MPLDLTIQTQPNGLMLPDLSGRLTRLTLSTNAHGDEALSCHAPLSVAQAFQRYAADGTPHAMLSDGAQDAFVGRIEDRAIRGDGVDLTAYGYSRALTDTRYTALWTTTDVTPFRPTRQDEQVDRSPEQYTFDTNSRILIALQQGQIYGNLNQIGGMIYQKPDGSSRQIVGVSFDAVVNLPVNWKFDFIQWQTGFAGPVTTTIDTGIGGANFLNKFYTFSGCDYLEFRAYNATGANYTVAAAPNVWSVRLTNVRLVTATTNMVNTTTTANVLAGASVSVPVVSSARMYVGQRLHMGIPAAIGFNATVLSIPDSTHFVADLSAAMASGGNVQAFVIYSDEIVRDLIGSVAGVNSTQLASSTALVSSPALDLFDESYADQTPAAVLDRLIGLGDNQTPPRQWQWAVDRTRTLVFQPDGTGAQTWYVDASALDVQRSLEQLANSIYAIYHDASGRTLRSAAGVDSASVAAAGLTRQASVNVSTTSLTQANVQRDAALSDQADPPPRFGITFTAIYNASGGRVPLWWPKAGDTIVVRNLPPTADSAIDQLRTFRIAHTTCDVLAATLTIEPLTPLPTLAALLARSLKGKTT